MNTDQPLEIERKFLIAYPNLKELDTICERKISMTQTYLISEKNLSRRIRKCQCDGISEYWYNEKERLSDMTRIERETEIGEKEYLEFLKEANPQAKTIRKTRYCIQYKEHCFEVDIFPEWNDRAFAEVELESEQEEFEIPDCLQVIKEVTADRRYTNHSLALHGFVYDEIVEDEKGTL